MKTNIITLFLLLAWMAAGCSGAGSSEGAKADSLVVDSLTTDSLNFDSLTAEQCGVRLAELEIEALLTIQQKGEGTVAATRAMATMNRAAMKIVERFQSDSVAQQAFNAAYDTRHTQLVNQHPELKDFASAYGPTDDPAQLGMLGAEMEIMTQLAGIEKGKDSEEYKKAEADMKAFQDEIIELYRDNRTAQEIYLQAYAAHYRELSEQLTAPQPDAQ
ncbi:MAG: hypothetical protein K2K79_07660 [Paramuribaculum sp.]|nr:hypothetical protein [Paramuribaculum sp.]